MRKYLALFLLLIAFTAKAQTTTTVSGVVTDTGGQTWNNGTFVFTFISNDSPPFSNGGSPYVPVPITGVLDNTGAYTAIIPSNATIKPVGSHWKVQVCPGATAPCFSQTSLLTISGATQTVNVTPTPILINPIPGAQAYSDAEIRTPGLGALYYNVTTGFLRLWNGTIWLNVAGSGGGNVGGSGTAGNIPLWTSPNTIGNSNWTDTLTLSLYHGTGGIGTNSMQLTGTPPYSSTNIEGPSANCLAIADGADNFCSVNDISPNGMWYAPNGTPYRPLCNDSTCGLGQGSQLISGGGVAWTGTGLNFTVSAAVYSINNVLFNSLQTNVTLAASDPTNPRIDVIAVDNTGTVVVLTGTPAPSPSTPVPNPLTQLGLSSVNVAANATTPTLPTILVYDENVGTPTEWNCTPSTNFNCNSTNNPYTGTHDIEATTAVAGNNVVLANTSTINPASYSTFSFNIRNKATWPSAKTVQICFKNGATVVGSCIGFKNGSFGFNQANLTSYQQIVIPLAQFALTGVVDRVTFTVAGGGTSIGFYLDLMQLQNSSGGGGGAGNVFTLEVNGVNTQRTANVTNSSTINWTSTPSLGFSTVQANVVSAPPSGTAGGALAGTYPNPTLANGTSCTNQVVTAISQSTAAGTCASVSNAMLVNSATTVNSQTCTLGSTCTVTATPTTGTIGHGLVFPVGDPTNTTALTTSSVSFYVTVPFACTINAYNLTVDAGTITVKFWKVATGTAIPTAGNSINTSGVSIATGTAIHSATVTDFTTTAVAANDIMAMAVTAVSGAHQVTGVLSCPQ